MFHCANFGIDGWDLEQLARYYSVTDRVHFIHEPHPSLTEDELVDLYNTADVMINMAGGEGWSLTGMEGAACGVPQLVPNWSATREIWRGTASLLPVSDFRLEPKFLNTAHAILDPVEAGRRLLECAKSPELLDRMRREGLAIVERQWTWAQVGDAFGGVIRRALDEGPPEPISFQHMLDARKGLCRSELADVVSLSQGDPWRGTVADVAKRSA